MKVFLGVAFAIVAALALIGCSLVEEESSQSSAEPEEVAATSEQTEETNAEETAPEETTVEESAPENIYEQSMRTEVPERLADIPERVYVPNVSGASVDVIDPETYTVIDSYPVGQIPHHVTPSYDMTELYVNNEGSNSFTVIDPMTGQPTDSIEVPFPYNLYFTPDGEEAIVVVERLQTVEFRDIDTWELRGSVYVPSPGVDHMDFTADGEHFVASTEWGGDIVKVDIEAMEIVETYPAGGAPVDVKLSPDGSKFYVANQGEAYNGLHVLDSETLEEIGFIPTGAGAHGLYPSKDAESLYVANRLGGTISVVDFETDEVTDTWEVGGTPDMIQLNPEGTEMWYADRFEDTVSVVSTETGELIARIPVGSIPHGLTYFPNVGDFNLGHNGIYR